MTLKEVKPGNSVTIRRLNSTGSVKKKLMDMGLTKNTEVYIRWEIQSSLPCAVMS